MLKKFIIALLGFAAIVAALGAVKVAQIKEASSAPHTQPPSAVTTAEAKREVWQPSISAIGTLAPVEGVTISADASGTVVRIPVESGSAVRAGDLLVELDTTVERAQLDAAQSRAELARINLDRAKELRESKVMANSDYDAAEASRKQAVADAAAIQAQIDKKMVRAPFAGRVGIRLVNVGQYIAPGRALLPLQKLDPIYVNFSVPQRHLQALSLGQKTTVTVDAFPEKSFAATITAIDSEVDAGTRNMAVQATLTNPQEQLRSGMFAHVELQLPTTEAVIVVPATAIAYAVYGNSVFIVETMKNAAGKSYLGVRQQSVKLGTTRGDLISILEGVKPGEQVVTAGVFKLRNGAAVEVNNATQPSSNPAPKPANS